MSVMYTAKVDKMNEAKDGSIITEGIHTEAM